MSIIIHLDKILKDHTVRNNELAKRIGITRANLIILKTGKAKAVRFSTLEAICKELNSNPETFWNF